MDGLNGYEPRTGWRPLLEPQVSHTNTRVALCRSPLADMTAGEEACRRTAGFSGKYLSYQRNFDRASLSQT